MPACPPVQLLRVRFLAVGGCQDEQQRRQGRVAASRGPMRMFLLARQRCRAAATDQTPRECIGRVPAYLPKAKVATPSLDSGCCTPRDDPTHGYSLRVPVRLREQAYTNGRNINPPVSNRDTPASAPIGLNLLFPADLRLVATASTVRYLVLRGDTDE